MSDETKNPAETPTNDGGGSSSGTATEPTEPTDEQVQVAAETPVNQGGGGD